jgi:hypothetical protein
LILTLRLQRQSPESPCFPSPQGHTYKISSSIVSNQQPLPLAYHSGFLAVTTRKSKMAWALPRRTAALTLSLSALTSSLVHSKTSLNRAAVNASTPSIKFKLNSVPISLSLRFLGHPPTGSWNFYTLTSLNPTA